MAGVQVVQTVRILGSPETWDQELPDNHSKYNNSFLKKCILTGCVEPTGPVEVYLQPTLQERSLQQAFFKV